MYVSENKLCVLNLNVYLYLHIDLYMSIYTYINGLKSQNGCQLFI